MAIKWLNMVLVFEIIALVLVAPNSTCHDENTRHL